MKIVNTDKGKAYQLKPDTQLEISRTNLFFNEWGEQSLPIDLPDTDNNNQILNYPINLSIKEKPSSKINCTISDGDFFASCRQAILSAKKRDKISTSFYLNEGSFLAKIEKTSLSEVFGNEVIPGISTIQQGIQFCRSLIDGSNPNYTIFPVLIDSEEKSDLNIKLYKYINRYGYMDQYGRFFDNIQTAKAADFYNAVDRSEKDGDDTISVPSGFYISPFLRANYVLKRVLSYFGYSLSENFFTKTAPFPSLTIINTCADALVNGTIKVADLLPDITCSDFMNIYRKKFCCEFVTDEVNKVVDIKLFNEIIDENPSLDLTPYITSQPEGDVPEYKKITLKSADVVSDDASASSYDSLSEMAKKFLAAEYDKSDGHFYRVGFSNSVSTMIGLNDNLILEKVGNSSMQFNTEDSMEEYEIEIPDVLPEFRKVYAWDTLSVTDTWTEKLLYVGAGNFLNSKLVSTTDSTLYDDSTSNVKKCGAILAFFYNDNGYPRGTISNYKMAVMYSMFITPKLWDYTLCYNGPDGIYEKFYRKIDNIYRNSLRLVKCELLLSTNLKQSIPSHLPVLIKGQKLLINSLNYTLGSKNAPVESEFYTTNIYEPVDNAPQMYDIISSGFYRWYSHVESVTVSAADYNSSPYKDAIIKTIFPQKPTYDVADGQKHYIQYSCRKVNDPLQGGDYYKLYTYWLECGITIAV